MADEITVRVAGRSFGYRGETYTRGEELDVEESTLDRHPTTLDPVDAVAGESSGDEGDTDPAMDDFTALPQIGDERASALRSAGYRSTGDLRAATEADLAEVIGTQAAAAVSDHLEDT